MAVRCASQMGAVISGLNCTIGNRPGAWMDTAPSQPPTTKPEAIAQTTPAQPSNESPSECPLCAMVKAGPCRDSFYPFESCLNRCEASGEDPSDSCRAPFAAMMQCIVQHPRAYAKFLGNSDDEMVSKVRETEAVESSLPGAAANESAVIGVSSAGRLK
jgi:hypothetical protein